MNNIELNLRPPACGVAGSFKIKVFDKNRNLKTETPWYDNLITDTGLDTFFYTSAFASSIALGYGNTAPTVSDSALEDQQILSASLTTTRFNPLVTSPYNANTQFFGTFNINLSYSPFTEIGMFRNSPSNALVTRALIPTPIETESGDTLYVYYNMKNYPQLIDNEYSQVVNINGNNHTITWHAASVGVPSSETAGWKGLPYLPDTTNQSPFFSFYSGNAASITSGPTGTGIDADYTNYAAYVNGTFERTYYRGFNLNSANYAGGINSISIGTYTYYGAGGFEYQANVSPAIMKTSSDIINVAFTVSVTRY